jgi:hypothetical protein
MPFLGEERTLSGFTDMLVRERKQRHVTCPLDRPRQRTLVLGAGAGLAAGPNLSPVCQEAPEHLRILVINLFDAFPTEGTHLWPTAKSPPRCTCWRTPPAASAGALFALFLFEVFLIIEVFVECIIKHIVVLCHFYSPSLRNYARKL